MNSEQIVNRIEFLLGSVFMGIGMLNKSGLSDKNIFAENLMRQMFNAIFMICQGMFVNGLQSIQLIQECLASIVVDSTIYGCYAAFRYPGSTTEGNNPALRI